MDENRKNWIELVHAFCSAMEENGFGVLESIEKWNTIYKPEIKALPPGRYTYLIGRDEITFTIKGDLKP